MKMCLRHEINGFDLVLRQTNSLQHEEILTLALEFMAICQMDAQVRYLNEVFTDVNVTTDVLYGQNVTVLPFSGAPLRPFGATSTSPQATPKPIVL